MDHCLPGVRCEGRGLTERVMELVCILSRVSKHSVTDIENRLVVANGEGVWGRDGLGVWDQQIQTIIYRMDTRQDRTYSTGNSIQYPVINHNGKEYEKECLYMYN